MKVFLALSFLLLFSLFSCNSKNNQAKKDYSQHKEKPLLTELEQSIERGSLVYNNFCIQCHGANGVSNNENTPSLVLNKWTEEHIKRGIIAIKYGQQSEVVINGNTLRNFMPPMGLSDEETVDVMNHLLQWANSPESIKFVTLEQVVGIEQ